MKKGSLNELMGRKGSKGQSKSLTLDDLGDLLGERMPKLEFSPVGRLRLTTALRNRFGDNYRHLPGIDGIETLKIIKSDFPYIQVVMMSGHGTIETAVKATKL